MAKSDLMSLSQEAKQKDVKVVMPMSGLATWKTIGRVLKSLLAKMGYRLEIDGAESVEQTSDGLHFKLRPGTAEGDHPWRGIVESSTLVCLGGLVNTIELDDELIAAGSGYCFVRTHWDLDIEHGYVFGAELVSAEIDTASSAPVDSPTTGMFHVILFTFDGSLVIQNARRHLQLRVCDDNSGLGRGVLIPLQT